MKKLASCLAGCLVLCALLLMPTAAATTVTVTGVQYNDKGESIINGEDKIHKYINIQLDKTMAKSGANIQGESTALGNAVRNNLHIDGKSIMEWIEYGDGDTYQVMVHQNNNFINLWFNGTREPGMQTDEAHWIEITDGMITIDNDPVAPVKLYYDPATKKWNIVNSFDGLKKPWFVEQKEQKNTTTEAPPTPTTKKVPATTAIEAAVTTVAGTTAGTDTGTDTATTTASSDNSTGGTSVPVWAMVVLIVIAVVVVGGVTFIIITKRAPKPKD